MQIGVNLRDILFLTKLSSPRRNVDLQLNVNVPFSTRTVCLEQSYIIVLFSSFSCLFWVFSCEIVDIFAHLKASIRSTGTRKSRKCSSLPGLKTKLNKKKHNYEKNPPIPQNKSPSWTEKQERFYFVIVSL